MPGPFPGMDPYLESRALWRGVYQGLIFALNQQLNTVLPPGFSASMDERASGEPFIEVLHHNTGAVVEILSPANKTPGAGREEYIRKQQSLERSATHLVEIDLLRTGEYILAVPEDTLRRRGERWDYLVCLHRGGQSHQEGQNYEYWPILVRESLPIIDVPLTEGATPVSLDLQAAFDQMYDAGPYRRRVRYDLDPETPLHGEDADWADALLRGFGLRGTGDALA